MAAPTPPQHDASPQPDAPYDEQFPYYRSAVHVQKFCRMRAHRFAMLVHATTRIPLSEPQIDRIEERMIDRAQGATSNDDITERVNATEDECAKAIQFRTPRMWKLCHSNALLLVIRLCVQSTRREGIRHFGSIAWRRGMVRTLSRRMFRAAARATDEADVNARLSAVYDATLAEHGIAADAA